MPGPGNYKMPDSYISRAKSTKNMSSLPVAKRFEEIQKTPGPAQYELKYNLF